MLDKRGVVVKKPRFLVLSGDGINCERESALALSESGFLANIVHLNELISAPNSLFEYDGMILPGGFSFADELGSGKVLAMKIVQNLGDEFLKFTSKKKPILGICNGFQVLLALKILPGATLTNNSSGKFIDKWSRIDVDDKSHCVWTAKVDSKIMLPIRHGEGKVVFESEDHYKQLLAKGQLPLKYEADENGSYENVAAICDSTGLIMGMMPHPECAVFKHTTPNGITPFGKQMFDSVYDYFN